MGGAGGVRQLPLRRERDAMIHQRVFLVGVVLVATLITGCDDTQPTQLIEPIDSRNYISFFDRGAVVPDAVKTMVVFDREQICSVSSRGEYPPRIWSRKLDGRDYDQMLSIVENNHLIGGADASLPNELCVGGRGFLVVITVEGVADTINVPGGAACDTSTWPVGLEELVDLKDDLIEKYGI